MKRSKCISQVDFQSIKIKKGLTSVKPFTKYKLLITTITQLQFYLCTHFLEQHLLVCQQLHRF